VGTAAASTNLQSAQQSLPQAAACMFVLNGPAHSNVNRGNGPVLNSGTGDPGHLFFDIRFDVRSNRRAVMPSCPNPRSMEGKHHGNLRG